MRHRAPSTSTSSSSLTSSPTSSPVSHRYSVAGGTDILPYSAAELELSIALSEAAHAIGEQAEDRSPPPELQDDFLEEHLKRLARRTWLTAAEGINVQLVTRLSSGDVTHTSDDAISDVTPSPPPSALVRIDEQVERDAPTSSPTSSPLPTSSPMQTFADPLNVHVADAPSPQPQRSSLWSQAVSRSSSVRSMSPGGLFRRRSGGNATSTLNSNSAPTSGHVGVSSSLSAGSLIGASSSASLSASVPIGSVPIGTAPIGSAPIGQSHGQSSSPESDIKYARSVTVDERTTADQIISSVMLQHGITGDVSDYLLVSVDRDGAERVYKTDETPASDMDALVSRRVSFRLRKRRVSYSNKPNAVLTTTEGGNVNMNMKEEERVKRVEEELRVAREEVRMMQGMVEMIQGMAAQAQVRRRG